MKQNRIAVVAAIIFIALMTTFSAWHDISSDRQKMRQIRSVENRFQEIITLDTVITELQKERRLTTAISTDPGSRGSSALSLQRQNTGHVLEISTKTPELAELLQKRARLLVQTELPGADRTETVHNYTALIAEALLKSDALVFNTDNAEIKNSLLLYQQLTNAQENAARLYAGIGTVLVSALLSDQRYREIVALNALYQHELARAEASKPDLFAPAPDGVGDQHCMKQTLPVVRNIINRSLDSILITPADWSRRSDCAVALLHGIAEHSLEEIGLTILQSRKAAEKTMSGHLLFWSGCILALSFLLVMSFVRSKALARGHRLLENYQGAIDYSTIVSKADKRGVITYVNRAFCEISGYSPNELLQQSHNIVRHPDMPPEVFQVMWSDLKEGKKWNGIIKNLKKDGTAYWVDASISPIFDHKGSLVEYIAIRRDITDIILLNKEIKDTQRELIYRMGEAVESRSKESGHHIQRVAHYSQLLAQVVGLNQEECEIIFAASTMHDIGKLSISDDILLKAGALSDKEWEIMKTHAETGYKILEGSERPLLKIAATVAYEHHEYFNGEGYPRGLKGEEISIYGRIVAIADVFDALATDRIYKRAWSMDEITAYMKSQSGKQFDPALIALFITHFERFLKIRDKFKDI